MTAMEEAELEGLVDAEIHAATERAKALFHALLSFLSNDPRLSETARAAIEEPANVRRVRPGQPPTGGFVFA